MTSKKQPQSPSRRRLSGALAALGAAPVIAPLAFPLGARAAQPLRIGYQKSSSLFILLKARGTLEKQFAARGIEVKWVEFTSGLPLLEGLNVGSIDLSADVADTVPLFAQAAGAKLTYVTSEAPSPDAQAIVVPPASPLKGVAELKGKKVALAKGAGVQYLLLQALERNGLNFRDIEPAYLNPADARAAFERGSVDAWAIWDPFLAAVQRQAGARVLTSGRGLASYRRFYLGATPYVEKNPEVVRAIVQELRATGQWVKQNAAEAAAFHAPLIGLDAATAEAANARRSYAVEPVSPEALTEQQRIADSFTQAGLLPKRITLKEVPVWS
jgi:sulfonate transport system substrate-binding protein